MIPVDFLKSKSRANFLAKPRLVVACLTIWKALDEKGKRGFFIDGKYRTMIYIDKKIYPNKKSIKKELNNLRMYSTIECKILRISKSNNFVSEPLNI